MIIYYSEFSEDVTRGRLVGTDWLAHPWPAKKISYYPSPHACIAYKSQRVPFFKLPILNIHGPHLAFLRIFMVTLLESRCNFTISIV